MVKLFDIKIIQPEDIILEDTARGYMLVAPTGGGSFCGGKISGKVLPVGMGISCTPLTGINIIEAPFLLETYAGAKIYMRLSAYLDLPQETEDRLASGDSVSPDEYYYKGTVSFDVSAPEYKWMENKVYVCKGVINDFQTLGFEVYEV